MITATRRPGLHCTLCRAIMIDIRMILGRPAVNYSVICLNACSSHAAVLRTSQLQKDDVTVFLITAGISHLAAATSSRKKHYGWGSVQQSVFSGTEASNGRGQDNLSKRSNSLGITFLTLRKRKPRQSTIRPRNSYSCCETAWRETHFLRAQASTHN